MQVTPADLERVRTERLVLSRPRDDDLEEVHALDADPAVRTHLPSGRHVLAQRTRVMLAHRQRAWDADGLGRRVAREPVTGRAAGALVGVGVGGCEVRHGAFCNLGYRLVPGCWGRGLAQEVIAAGPDAGNPDPSAVRLVHADRPLRDDVLAAVVGS